MMPIIQTDKPLRKRDKFDFYPTPIELCRASLGIIKNNVFRPNWKPKTVLDPGAGEGVWGRALLEKYGSVNWLVGVEIREDIPLIVGYDDWYTEDFLEFPFGSMRFDLIMGNPPYKYAEEFIEKSFSLLESNGYIIFLLRLSFLESKKRYNSLYKSNFSRPNEVYVSTRRPSFTGDGKTDSTAYAVYVWQKLFIPSKGYNFNTSLKWLDWDYD